MRVAIPENMLHHIFKLALDGSPREVLGILGAKLDDPSRIAGFAPLANRSPTPRETFMAAPDEQYRAELHMGAQGMKTVGSYHSHPRTAPEPSGMDTELLHPEHIMLIVSLVDPTRPTIRAWKRNDETASSEEVMIVTYRPYAKVAS